MYRQFNSAQLASVAMVAALAAALYGQVQFDKLREVRRDRNFYAALMIRRSGLHTIELRHGQTSHGFQSSDQPTEPTSYYARHRGIGLFMEAKATCTSPCPVSYGIIGMGVGTLAAYGRPGDTFRFYELNPQIIGYSTGPKAFPISRISATRLQKSRLCRAMRVFRSNVNSMKPVHTSSTFCLWMLLAATPSPSICSLQEAIEIYLGASPRSGFLFSYFIFPIGCSI